MLLRLAAITLATAACAEPVVEMELHMPANADTFDTSCVSGVSVVVAGANYAQDWNDSTGSCQEITGQNRMTGIHDAIRGKFTVSVPASGMSGIEIFGWSGPAPCQPPEYTTPDLIFHSSAAYIGQDTVDLKLETTLDCAKSSVKVHPVDLFVLLSGATPSSTNCTAAVMADSTQGFATVGQIMERDLAPGVDFFGGLRGADVTGGIASFSVGTTGLTRSCLAYDAFSSGGFGTSCAMTGGKVCAAADEIEAPFIERNLANEALTFDETLLAKWDSMVFVSVWNNANPKKPIAGATIQVAPADGQVVYVDPPAAGTTKLVRRTDNMTGASGLAVVFTNKLAKVKVTAAGASREVVVAAPDYSAGAALVVMP